MGYMSCAGERAGRSPVFKTGTSRLEAQVSARGSSPELVGGDFGPFGDHLVAGQRVRLVDTLRYEVDAVGEATVVEVRPPVHRSFFAYSTVVIEYAWRREEVL